jgi:hypothetical protein
MSTAIFYHHSIVQQVRPTATALLMDILYYRYALYIAQPMTVNIS